MKQTFVLLLCFLLLTSVSYGRTITATSVSYSDVNCAVTGGTGCTVVVDGVSTPNFTGYIAGDTVQIPAGSATWTNQISFSGIRVIGAGENLTIITDDVVHTDTKGVFTITGAAGTELTGLTIQKGTAVANQALGAGAIHILGGNVVDGCWIHNVTVLKEKDYAIRSTNAFAAVTDCTFQAANSQSIYVENTNFNSKSFGDGSWNDDPLFGGNKDLVVERCTFTKSGTTGCFDGNHGARLVFRYNTTDTFCGSHGTESTGRNRGFRKLEMYGNSMTSSGVYTTNALVFRSGTLLFWGNTINNFTGMVVIDNYRTFASFSTWGGADGVNPWDLNDDAGGVYASGTHTFTEPATASDLVVDATNNKKVTAASYHFTAGDTAFSTFDMIRVTGGTGWTPGYYTVKSVTGNAAILDNSPAAVGTTGGVWSNHTNSFDLLAAGSPGWTQDQYKGFVLRNTTSGHTGIKFSEIKRNDGAAPWSITNRSAGQYVNDMYFLNGETFEIRKVLEVLDGVGSGKGDLLSGNTPINTAQGNVAAYPRNNREPVYGWLNTLGSNNSPNFSNQTGTIIQGRDYFNASQTGVGTKAQMLATTGTSNLKGSSWPGTAWWVTDEGSWNTTVAAGTSGQLYVWINGAWALYYTPRQYPHPLSSGASAPILSIPSVVSCTPGNVTACVGVSSTATTSANPLITVSTVGNPIPTFTPLPSPLPSWINIDTTEAGKIKFYGVPPASTPNPNPYATIPITAHNSTSPDATGTITIGMSNPTTFTIGLPATVDLPICFVGKSTTQLFIIHNTGTGSITLTGATGLPSDATISFPDGAVVTPNAVRSGMITWTPTSARTVSQTVTLTSTETITGTKTFTLTGTSQAQGRVKLARPPQ